MRHKIWLDTKLSPPSPEWEWIQSNAALTNALCLLINRDDIEIQISVADSLWEDALRAIRSQIYFGAITKEVEIVAHSNDKSLLEYIQEICQLWNKKKGGKE